MYKCENLTQLLVTLKTKEDIIQFLSDRKRSVNAALRKNPSPDLAIELNFINALQQEFAKET